jgi:hypothetical protein
MTALPALGDYGSTLEGVPGWVVILLTCAFLVAWHVVGVLRDQERRAERDSPDPGHRPGPR